MKKSEILEKVRFPELTKKVCRQIGGRFWEIIEECEDYTDASIGIPGFTYYCDTEKFFKRNSLLILECLEEIENETGKLKKDNENLANWFSWFAVEVCMQELAELKEEGLIN